MSIERDRLAQELDILKIKLINESALADTGYRLAAEREKERDEAIRLLREAQPNVPRWRSTLFDRIDEFLARFPVGVYPVRRVEGEE